LVKVLIPMKYGETLKTEVLKGLSENYCEALVITSENTGEDMNTNKCKNILNGLKYIDGDLFLMDSDVILPYDSILDMQAELRENPIITLPTKPCHQEDDYPSSIPHSMLCVRKDYIEEFKRYLQGEGCHVCKFVNANHPKVLWWCRGREL
jgi:hypothetical protein